MLAQQHDFQVLLILRQAADGSQVQHECPHEQD